jgi:tRNA(Ile)-lysidine synthase
MRIPGPTHAQSARFATTFDALAPRGAPVILGVSGGPDSLALLLLAASVRPGGVIAATVDHQLREGSALEARHVFKICQKLEVHHATIGVKVAEDDPSGMQAAAREERYAGLARYARRKEASAIATAHHVDDQAETVLMRLARGAGVAGLAGVRDKRPLEEGIQLIRPLLGWRRAELAAIVQAAKIDAVDDPSNHDTRFDRTRARSLLAQGWPDPLRVAAIGRHMADADEALDWVTNGLFVDRFTRHEDGALLDTAGLPREIVRRLALAAIRALAPEEEAPRGDELIRLLDRVEAGHISTLGTLQVAPGRAWRFQFVKPHRADP